jgi:ParB family chromosome partitioning protein
VQIAALSEEYDGLVEQGADVEELPAEVDARLKEIDAALEGFGDGYAYDADDLSRGGAFVYLGSDGGARIERGFIRPEDEAPEPEDGADDDGEPRPQEGGAEGECPESEEEPDGLTPLSDRLVLELSAYRTAGLREALGREPDVALIAVVHAMALPAFYPVSALPNCLEIKTTRAELGAFAPGLADSPAGRAVCERHGQWATRLPAGAGELWDFLIALGGGELLDLLAHCASLTLNALQQPWERKPAVMAHTQTLARAVGLDMTKTWSATRDTYLGRVTKARIVEAVREAVGTGEAERLEGLKKPDMAEAAERLIKDCGWLPPMLRTAEEEPQREDGEPSPSAIAAE